MDQVEKITAAAIKWRRKGEEDFQYVTGLNHAQCIEAFSFMEIYAHERDMEHEVQGFITSKGRFIDRTEAVEIAKNAGQVSPYFDRHELISEFIDWNA